MKWIGQHIWDFISRFRSHVYFEDSITLSTGKSITMDEYTSDTVSITKIQDSGTSFNDNDTSLLTAAAIADKIEGYGYSTTSGDITGVTITTDSGGGATASDAAGSADFSILGATGVGVTNSGTTITATAVPAEIDHDSLSNFVAAEHYDWSSDISGTATIHANNITDLHGAGVDGSADQLLTDDGDGSITSESTLTWSGTSLTTGDTGSSTNVIKRKAAPSGDAGSMHIQGGDGTAGQTNQDGGGVDLKGGVGTGSGGGGDITMKTATPNSSGTSLNSLDNTWTFDDNGMFTTANYGIREKVKLVTTTFEDILADGDHMSSKVLIYGADETLTDGRIYFLHTDATWDEAQADDVATGASQLLGVGNGRTVSAGVILEGFIRVPDTEIIGTPVIGAPVYISETTAGHFDFTRPSGNDEFVRVVGYCIDTHDDSGVDALIYFKPDNTWVKVTA